MNIISSQALPERTTTTLETGQLCRVADSTRDKLAARRLQLQLQSINVVPSPAGKSLTQKAGVQYIIDSVVNELLHDPNKR